MEIIQEYIGLIIAVIVVAAVIIFQIRNFLKTKGKIKIAPMQAGSFVLK